MMENFSSLIVPWLSTFFLSSSALLRNHTVIEDRMTIFTKLLNWKKQLHNIYTALNFLAGFNWLQSLGMKRCNDMIT